MPRYKLLIEYAAKEPFLPYDNIRLKPGKDSRDMRDFLSKTFRTLAELGLLLNKDGNIIKGESGTNDRRTQQNQ